MMNVELLKIQEELNKKLGEFFKDNGITNFCITSLGNSIGSGYSMTRITKPLLLRNESLEIILSMYGVSLERHNFARAQNNNDEHLYNWLIDNVSEANINKLNRFDYTNNSPCYMPVYGIDNSNIDSFYPINSDSRGLQDIILDSNSNLANVVIYNGCTGSFLDNITRGGKISNKFMSGIKRDVGSLEATLKFIQEKNRKNRTNTQVYICGAPNFLGLGITEIINYRLKDIASKFANTTYVKPVRSKFFYRNIETGKISVDIHYNENEYLKFNNNIIESINDNYAVNREMIELDRNLVDISNCLEFGNNTFFDIYKDKINECVIALMSNNYKKLRTKEEKEKFKEKALNYFTENFPYDYYYIGKDSIIDGLKKTYKK